MTVILPFVHVRLPIIIIVAISLHLIWAVGLAIDPAAHQATALHALLLLTSNPITASAVLTIIACLAGLGCTWQWDLLGLPMRIWQALLILPQQCILIMSSIGCINAMLNSAFVDGVARPRWFIIVDQIPIILITVGHVTAVASIARTRGRDEFS